MKHLIQYIILEYKKAAAILANLLVSLLLMLFLVVGIVAGVGYFIYQIQVFEPIKVAVVIPGEQAKVTMYVRLLKLTDSVKSICDIEVMEENDAYIQMEDGAVQAIILINEDFYNDVNYGTNTPMKVVLRNSRILKLSVFREILNDGISIIGTTESAIYSVTDMSKEYTMEISKTEMEALLTDIYVETAMERGSVFVSNILLPIGELTIYQYYIGTAATILLLFIGLNFGFMYKRQEVVIEQKLQIYGINHFVTGIVRVLVMTSALWLISLVLFILLQIAVMAGLPIDYSFDLKAVFLMIIPTVSIAAFLHLLYSISQDQIQSGMLLLTTGLFMILASGSVLPSVYLPKALQISGAILPLTAWREGILSLLFDYSSGKIILVQLLYMLLFIGMGELLRWRRV